MPILLNKHCLTFQVLIVLSFWYFWFSETTSFHLCENVPFPSKERFSVQKIAHFLFSWKQHYYLDHWKEATKFWVEFANGTGPIYFHSRAPTDCENLCENNNLVPNFDLFRLLRFHLTNPKNFEEIWQNICLLLIFAFNRAMSKRKEETSPVGRRFLKLNSKSEFWSTNPCDILKNETFWKKFL